MGTDIHGRIQVRHVEWARDNDTVIGEATMTGGRKHPIKGYSAYTDAGEIECERNYLVFAILADVRNGYGFAGCKTHTPLEPIDAPRGLPDDCNVGKGWDYSEFDDESNTNPQSRKIPYSEFEFGEHSQSWLTLTEILAWPHWNNTLHHSGVLDRAEYERVQREGGTPNSWYGFVSGPNVITTTHEDVVNGTAPDDWNLIQYDWEAPIMESVDTFYKWVQYLASKYAWQLEQDPAAVRLVFGFDS